MNEARTNRVHLCGCRSPDQEALALQLLGQAWLYREDLRHVYNRHKAIAKARWEAEREATHVTAYEANLAKRDECAHVVAYGRRGVWASETVARNADIRVARSKRGHLLDAGTYWLVEEAIAVANKDAGLDPIRKVPFDMTGRIGVAIQSTDTFEAGDTFEHSRVVLMRNAEKPKYHLLRVFVGALAEARAIVFPMKLDRSFPEGAIIKRVTIQRIRSGHRYSWQALFTIDIPVFARDAAAMGHVGIDLGWRMEPGEKMRVATHDGVLGPDQKTEQGVLLIDTLRSFEYADSVRGFRDEAFTFACAYAKASGIAGAEYATQWKAKSRLHRLQAKHPTDLGLAWWRLRDRHLEDIECQVRTKAERRRLDAFRVYADCLAKSFRFAVLEDMPMQTWVGRGETSTRERARSVAALSMLQNAILHRFGKARVLWVPAEDSTRTCSSCGTVKDEAVGKEARWVCEGCNTEHHQDENAAIVLRRRGERLSGDGMGGGARTRKAPKRKGKKKKVTEEMSKEKVGIGAAREALANAAE